MIRYAFNGMPVVLVDAKVMRVRRTWRERLRSKFWQATKEVRVEPQFPPGTPMPHGAAFVLGGSVYIRACCWERVGKASTEGVP